MFTISFSELYCKVAKIWYDTPIDRFFILQNVYFYTRKVIVCVLFYVIVWCGVVWCGAVCVPTRCIVCYLKTVLHFNTYTYASNTFSLFSAPLSGPHLFCQLLHLMPISSIFPFHIHFDCSLAFFLTFSRF